MVETSSEDCLSQSGHFFINLSDLIRKRMDIKWDAYTQRHSIVTMEIPMEDYPDWFKEGHFDGLLVHCARDTESAQCFKDFLRRIIESSEDPDYPKICLLNPSDGYSEDLRHVERLVDKSTYIFLLITDNFLEDCFCQMMQDELIMTTVCNNDDRWKVIPVYLTRPANRIPLGIRAINAISLSRFAYTGSMMSLLPILTKDNIGQFDRFLAKHLQNIFASKQHLRTRREEADLKRLECWLSQEREKREWD